MIEIIKATTTYPKKNWGISKMEDFVTEEIVSTADIFFKVHLFFRKFKWLGYFFYLNDKLVTGLLVVQFCP